MKKGKERAPGWLSNVVFLVVLPLASIGVFWLVNREPGTIELKYGELKQLLQAPGVTFQNVRIDPSEIRGELITRDPVLDGKDNAELAPAAIGFRTSRLGLQFDQSLQALLDKHVGPGYRGGEDDKDGKNGKAGRANRSGSPAKDSEVKGNVAPGETDKKNFKMEGGWGALPAKARAKAREDIARKFPANYRQAIEEFTRKQASRSSNNK